MISIFSFFHIFSYIFFPFSFFFLTFSFFIFFFFFSFSPLIHFFSPRTPQTSPERIRNGCAWFFIRNTYLISQLWTQLSLSFHPDPRLRPRVTLLTHSFQIVNFFPVFTSLSHCRGKWTGVIIYLRMIKEMIETSETVSYLSPWILESLLPQS